MTNYERIKNMSVEQFAKHRLQQCPNSKEFGCKSCFWKPKSRDSCYMCWLDWLNQEVEK